MIKKLFEWLKNGLIFVIGAVGLVLFGIYAFNLALTIIVSPIAIIYGLIKAICESIVAIFELIGLLLQSIFH
jgi:hypothetical protein